MADTFKKTDMLVYTSGATERIMRKEDWEGVGIKDQDLVVWSRTAPGVQCGDMTAAAVKYMLEHHGDEFRIDSDKTPAGNGD